MSRPLTCPQGHRWEITPAAAADDTPDQVACPVCGVPVATAPASVHTDDYHSRGSTPPPEATSSSTERPRPSAGERFRVLHLHARGGLGQVSIALDRRLRRQVALKEIRPDRLDPAALARFLAEAEITGQLEHPGIVPIYALEEDGDGQPYYAMRLVQGRTLAQALAAYHGAPSSLGLNELLGRFLSVCQTLAYAHSRGVIHRNLKPANVMLGDYGETLVLDWGLAKRLRDRTERDSASAVVPEAAEGEPAQPPQQTGAGVVLGTPAYMAPEQARGEAHLLDERCDVFGLGAVLCEILTGLPPYTADKGNLREQASRGDLGNALTRLATCGADPALVALCRACLAPDLGERPEHAGLVAEHLAVYQARVQERLRRAEVERAEAQVKAREERKRRRLQLGLAAALLVLAVSGGGAALWYQQQEAATGLRLAQAEAGVREALKEAMTLAGRAETQVDQPEVWHSTLDASFTALKQAETLLTKEPALNTGELRAKVNQARARLEAAEKDRQLVVAFEAVLFKLSAFRRNPPYTRAYGDVQAALARWGLPPAGLPVERATALIRQRPREIQERLFTILYIYLQPTPVTEHKQKLWLEEVLAAADPDPWRRKVRRAVADGKFALLKNLVDEADLAKQSPLFLLKVENDPLLQDSPVRIALLRRGQQKHPQDFWLNLELSNALLQSILPITARSARDRDRSVIDEVIRFGTAALALRPNSPQAHNDLGVAMIAKGDLTGAIDYFQKALELDDTNVAAHVNLGSALRDQGDLARAIACYQRALALDPNNAQAHTSLGNALNEKKEVARAIAHCQRALALDPNNAQAHTGLGNALRAQKDLAGAIAAYEKALDLDPSDAKVHTNLGAALYDKRDLKGAIACYQKALALDPKLAQIHYNLGVALRRKQDLAGAIPCFQRAIELDPKFALAHHNLGLALQAQGNLTGALTHYSKAVEIDPLYAQAHFRLGHVLGHQGDRKGAIRHYQKGLELDPQNARGHNDLGRTLKAEGNLQAAILHYQKAVALDPKLIAARYNLGNPVQAQGDLKGAVAHYRQAITLNPEYAPAHTNLGNALSARKDWQGAIAHYRKALALDPQDPHTQGGLGQALLGQGDFQQARAATQKALQLLPPAISSARW
jgi:tetratricopeptide (TPR) repeat protein